MPEGKMINLSDTIIFNQAELKKRLNQGGGGIQI